MIYLLALTLVLAPAYAIKFNIGPLPVNLLLIWLAFVLAVGLANLLKNNSWKEFKASWWQQKKIITVLALLFLLSGFISLLVKGPDIKKLGQFIVIFLEPVALFFLSGFVLNKQPKDRELLATTSYYLLAALGLFAVVQYFTLYHLPLAFQGNMQEPKRALSLFSHPNFYALFAAPLLGFLLADLFGRAKNAKNFFWHLSLWLIGAIGLLLSLSRAGWMGVGLAFVIFLLLVKDKKLKEISRMVLVAAALIMFIIPSIRLRILSAVNGEKSADSRIELWQSGEKAIKTSPIFGLGLNGYSNRYWEFQTDRTLDSHNFPHNIFLDVWVETGILGLISFIGVLLYGLFYGFKNRHNTYSFGLSLFLIALISQGLIDNPYFKNDLAAVFWLIMSLL